MTTNDDLNSPAGPAEYVVTLGEVAGEDGVRRAAVFFGKRDGTDPPVGDTSIEIPMNAGIVQSFERIQQAMKTLSREAIDRLAVSCNIEREELFAILERLDAEIRALEGDAGEPKPERLRRPPSPAVPDGDYMEVPASAGYRALQAVIQDPSRFQDGGPWPCAIHDNLNGIIEARPPEADLQPWFDPEEEARLRDCMWQQVGQLGDLDADVLDALSDFWIRHARHPDQKVVCTVSYLLERRGMKPKKSGAGRRGGYYASQENAIRAAVGRISILLVSADVDTYHPQPGKRRTRKEKKRVSSRAVVVDTTAGQMRLDGRTEVQAFTFCPGSIFAMFLFGPGRQVALQSVRALSYHQKNEWREKRLTRYLSWQWKCDAKNGGGVKTFRLRTLLDAIAEQPNTAHPSKTLERLVDALDRLKSDGVIGCWSPSPEWNAIDFGKPGWLQAWLEATVDIEPPGDISERYGSLVADARRQALPPGPTRQPDLPARLRAHRKALGMSCLQVGEVLGVTGRAVGYWESGARKPAAGDRKRIMSWLDGGTDGTEAGP